MPKSKRDRVVPLTKTVKKGKALKQKLIESIQDSVNEFSNIFVFSAENMKNSKLKEIRAAWSTSRFFLGKNKVSQVALGRRPEEEYKPNLSRVAQQLMGKRGLFFTNSSEEEVRKYFDEVEDKHYARSGFKSTEDFVVEAGPLPSTFPVSMEPVLRKLGLQVRVQEGKLTLPLPCRVCSKGDILTPEACKLLELIHYPMAVFRLRLHCAWSDGHFKAFDVDSASAGHQDEEEEEAGDAAMQNNEEEEAAGPVTIGSSTIRMDL